ncbi:unnamed protein product [Calypogeia fissa]
MERVMELARVGDDGSFLPAAQQIHIGRFYIDQLVSSRGSATLPQGDLQHRAESLGHSLRGVELGDASVVLLAGWGCKFNWYSTCWDSTPSGFAALVLGGPLLLLQRGSISLAAPYLIGIQLMENLWDLCLAAVTNPFTGGNFIHDFSSLHFCMANNGRLGGRGALGMARMGVVGVLVNPMLPTRVPALGMGGLLGATPYPGNEEENAIPDFHADHPRNQVPLEDAYESDEEEEDATEQEQITTGSQDVELPNAELEVPSTEVETSEATNALGTGEEYIERLVEGGIGKVPVMENPTLKVASPSHKLKASSSERGDSVVLVSAPAVKGEKKRGKDPAAAPS